MTMLAESPVLDPPLGFVRPEHRTSEFLASKLTEFGCEVRRNIGKTGVVSASWERC
jgi:metal-dependent amidase/aminoacylase/carboxypeptidase family protein